MPCSTRATEICGLAPTAGEVIHRTVQGSASVSESASLSRERVRALYEDSGIIWVATQNGVERITPEPVRRSGGMPDCFGNRPR